MIHQLHHLNLCFTKLLFFSFHSHKSAKKYSCQVPQVPVLPAPGEARRLQFSRMKPHVNQQKHYFWGIFVECWCWFNARPQEVHRESIGGSWTISKPQKYPCRIAYIKELNTSWLEMKPCNSLSCIFEASLIDIVAILSFGLARMSFFFSFNFACPTYQKFPTAFEVNLWKELGVDMKALNPDDWESKFGEGMQRDMHSFFALFVKHKNRHLWYLCIMESLGVLEGSTI